MMILMVSLSNVHWSLYEQTVTPSDNVVTQSTQQAESFTLFITHWSWERNVLEHARVVITAGSVRCVLKGINRHASSTTSHRRPISYLPSHSQQLLHQHNAPGGAPTCHYRAANEDVYASNGWILSTCCQSCTFLHEHWTYFSNRWMDGWMDGWMFYCSLWSMTYTIHPTIHCFWCFHNFGVRWQ